MTEPREPLAGRGRGLRGVAGIILAGGASRRFGRDKLVEDLGGRPLVRHAIDALVAHVDEVVVAVRPGQPPDALEVVASSPVPVRSVADAVPDGGPLVGLAAALDGTTAELALVLGGDMPFVPGAILELLADRLRGGADAAALLDGTTLRPLPLGLRVGPARATAERCLARDRRSLLALLDDLGAEAIPEAVWRAIDPTGLSLRDVDRPADLEPPGRG